ncbi:MAG: M48 family metalloprotease, partial [Sedimentisphaerales bacterium]|nr:M48 family metalloprotease [Sedimentisphaerales bacterium]
PINWQGLVFLVWYAGVFVFAVLLLQRAWFVKGLLRQGKEARADLKEILDGCCKKIRLNHRNIELKISANMVSPAVCGIFKHTILLPGFLVDKLSTKQLQNVIIHELAHIKRRDLPVNLIQTILQIVYFYNPLLWLANAIIRRVREQAVDEMVLVTLDKNAPDYSHTLIDIAEMAFHRPSLSLRLIGVVESKKALSGRIKHIVSRPLPKSAKLGIFGMIAIFIIAAIMLPMAECKLNSKENIETLSGEKKDVIKDKADNSDKEFPKITHGIIKDKQSRPIPNSRVILFYKSRTWGLEDRILEETQSKSDGTFVFNSPLEFPYSINSKRTSYIIMAIHQDYAVGWHEVHYGKEQDSYKIILTEPKSHTITVTDHDDNPLEGVWVWPYDIGDRKGAEPLFRQSLNLRSDPGFLGGTTDIKGKATITNLPKTRCSFHATLKGYARGLAWPGGTHIRLSKGANVSGIVLTKDGHAVENAIVRFSTNWMWQFFLALTDNQGRFHFEDIPAKGWDMSPWGNSTNANGAYKVTIKHEKFTAEEQKLQVEPGQIINDFNIQVIPGTLVRVKVLEPGTEQVIKGARIQGDSESGRLDGYSNENGLFERRVLPGRTDIWFLSPPTGFYVLDKDRVEVGDTVINAEGDVKEVTIYAPSKLYPLTTVRGKVLLPNGSPVGGVKISTSNSARYNGAGFHGSGGAYTGTNMDGTFELKDVPAGLQLFLYAQTKDYKYVLAENLRPLEGENNLAEPLIIQSGETAEVLFTDEKGNPRSNMKLKIQPMMWDSIIFRSDSRPIQTDSNGMVKVDGIVPGMKYFVCDAQMNRSRRNWSDTYFYQKVRLIPEDKQKTIKAVLSHNMIVNVTDSNGHIIPIKSIESLYILTPAGKRTRGRTINIEDRLSDGSVLINNKHLTSAKSEYEMEINVVTDKDKSVLAIGKFPDDASNRLTFVAHHGNDNKDHLLKQGAGKSVGQSPALQDEGKSKFVATLPNGVTVELVGVCEHPSKGKQWWRPDGKVIEEQDRPYEKLGFFAMTYPENKLFELAVRVKHAPTGDVGIISNLVRGTFLKCNNNTWGNTLDVKKTTEKVYINLGVATGPWKREAFSTAKFGRRRSRSPGFAFTEAYDTDKGYAAVTITHKKDIHKENYRVIAVDKDRQTYVADLYQNDKVDGMKQTTVHFKTLKADQIQHFEFQTRPYQWVTFKNVSLKTNSKTDVQIEVEKSNRQTNEKPAQAGPSIQDLLKVPQAHFDMLSQAYGKKNWQLANQAATELRDFFRQNDERIIQQFADSAESENIIELVAVVEELSGEVHDSIRDGKMYLIHAYYEELGKKWRELKNVPLKRVDQSPTLPIGYWNFDGDAKDSIGNNHGIVYGATLTEGISGQAYYFEGDGDCISVPDSDVFDFGADDFTLSAWFKMSVLKSPFPFILNFRQNDNNPHIEIYAGVDLGTHIVPGFTRITYRDAGINDDKWHNVAITLENGEENGYRLYLDGIQVGKATYAGRLQDWDTITIGTQKKNSRDKFAFKGFIDEVAVYDKALSAEEIQNIYNTIQITEKPDRKTDVQVEENKTGETIARRLAKPVQRTSRLKQRTESMGRLRKIGLALVMYADDHKKYPDSLDKLKSYIQDDVLDWAQDNVAYFGRGKSITTDPQIAIAYDKTLLKKENSQGTNVLYSDTHVAFRKTKQLKQQGLVPKDKIAVPVETKNVEKTNWVVEDYGQTRLLSNKERPEVDWVSIIASVVKNNGCYLVPDNGLTLKELIKAAGYNRDKLDESYVTVSREIKQGSQRAFKLYSRNLETLFSGKESNIPLKHGDAIVGGFIEPSPNADEFWGRYHFGDVIELTVNDDNAKTNMFVDLDTAKLIT